MSFEATNGVKNAPEAISEGLKFKNFLGGGQRQHFHQVLQQVSTLLDYPVKWQRQAELGLKTVVIPYIVMRFRMEFTIATFRKGWMGNSSLY